MKTDTSLCIGCNKCITVCPVQANDAMYINGKNVIQAQEKLCIYCGNCIDACTHQARCNHDDSESFIDALKAGVPFSLLVAPSVRANLPRYRRVLGYLKQLGVKFFYDVSFGADISTWGYVRNLQQGKGPLITQPCPVVVRYIEKFLPELLPRLAPVHSPAMCTAIYMKQVMGIDTSLAFLSPCIAKKMEFEDGETGDFIQLNVTFQGLLQYLEDKNIDLNEMPEVSFDNPAGAMGFIFPRPGGLTENLRLHMDEDIWVRQIEGIDEVEKYLQHYAKRVELGLPVPLVVDLLSCKQGCNNGTGTAKHLHLDDIDFDTNQRKAKVDIEQANALFRHFDDTLNLDAFSRGYTVRSHERLEVSDEQLEEAFILLGKEKQDDREIDCFSCGFSNCYSFARAVALGQNHKWNCVQYMQQRLDEQTEELRKKNEDNLGGLRYASKIQRRLLPNEQEMKLAFAEYHLRWLPKDIVGGDLYWVKSFHDGVLVCVGDCTGHGTPGALLTMLVISALEAVVKEENHKDIKAVVCGVDKYLAKSMDVQPTQRDANNWIKSTQINDGVDFALIYLSHKGSADLFSAGGVRVLVSRENTVERYKGQRVHLGDGMLASNEKLRVHHIEQDKGCRYFLVTDGLSDQIGEDSRLPFGYKRTETLIKEHHDKPLSEVFDMVLQAFTTHKGAEEQRDDITLLAFQR